MERTAAILVCEKQPTELLEAPSDLRERGDRNADDWLAWYTFVSLYTLPGSRWVEDDGEPAPWRIVPGWGGENNIGNARWLAVYIRIRAFVGTVKKAERPKTNVEQALGRGAETTSAERTAALSAWAKRSQMTSYPSAPEPAMRTQGSRSAKDWIANVVYWALYADPQSLWVQDGNEPAPWKASGEWAQVWLRIRTYIGTLAADSGKPATPEPGSTLTTAERQAIDSTMWLKLQSADPSVVPPPDNVRKPGTSDVDWYTNYAYWAAYRSPGAEWIQAGNAPAPVTIPAGSVWRPVWLRIRNGVAAKLGGG